MTPARKVASGAAPPDIPAPRIERDALPWGPAGAAISFVLALKDLFLPM